MNLLELPKDTIIIILSYIGFDDIKNVTRICKLFHFLIFHDSNASNLICEGIAKSKGYDTIYIYDSFKSKLELLKYCIILHRELLNNASICYKTTKTDTYRALQGTIKISLVDKKLSNDFSSLKEFIDNPNDRERELSKLYKRLYSRYDIILAKPNIAEDLIRRRILTIFGLSDNPTPGIALEKRISVTSLIPQERIGREGFLAYRNDPNSKKTKLVTRENDNINPTLYEVMNLDFNIKYEPAKRRKVVIE
jgi:hypothetical protein